MKHLSSHYSLDDSRHWRFERNSGLPYGYFDGPRISVDALVVGVSVVCAVIAVWVAL